MRVRVAVFPRCGGVVQPRAAAMVFIVVVVVIFFIVFVVGGAEMRGVARRVHRLA